MSSKFFTNSNDRGLFDKFTGIVDGMKDLHAFHAVVGYFRSSGYFALQPYLKDLKEIKILVGINVDQMFAETQRKGLLFFGDDEKAKGELLKDFIKDIREAKYSKEVEDGIAAFITDLISGRIEVRAHRSKAIHAKFYLFLPEHHNSNSDGWVIMGSSNLTEAGLGIKKSPNYELNIALKDFDDVQFAKGEFESLWAESTPILPADIERFKEKTHIGKVFTPYEIYLKFLIEYFGRNIDYDPDTVGDLPTNFKKLSYQIDAVNEGFQMLLQHNGFFLADVVGLGKTVVSAMIAKRFLIANGTLHSKVLVVYPPALEKNWKDTFRHFGIDRHTKFISNGRLERIVKGDDPNYWPMNEYDLVLVDEAHRYRNHTSQMFQNLQIICKSKAPGEGFLESERKKVILISATPLNNRPEDLYYQLQLFMDARRSSLTVTNLQTFFGPKTREYQEIISKEEPDLERIRSIYAEIREKVVAPITVRRTRLDLKNYPKYLDDLEAQGIIFPEIAAPRAIEYKLEGKLGELFVESMGILTTDIKYFRYQAVGALTDENQEKYYPQARIVSLSLARILQTLMVKRLESSFFAFRRTLGNLAKATERMIQMFEADKVFIAPDMDVNALMEKGLSIDEVEAKIIERSIADPDSTNRVFASSDFSPDFPNGLREDLRLLNELIERWSQVREDPKLEFFFNSYDSRFLDNTENRTGKLVIFTESKDTADYLTDSLKKRFEIEALNISASNRTKLYETIRDNFDANYTEKPKDDYKVLITTDVLAEGVNLHRANVIINYDTPWNATRLMQRVGRVNRIGSVAGVVYNYNFYPSPQGNALIKLYQKATVKLQAFHSAFGEDAQVYTHEEFVEQFNLFREGLEDEEDKRLHYLRVIREFKEKNPLQYKAIKSFPMKARTGRRANSDNSDSTIVFLKSPYKSEFYRTAANANPVSLTFLEAAAVFEAEPPEPAVDPLPDWHYEQVLEALATFERDFFGSTAETVTTTDKADSHSNQAKKFLREIRSFTKHDDVKDACTGLTTLIDNGTYAQLPIEVKRMRQRLQKKLIQYPQVDALVLSLAKKYSAVEPEQNEDAGFPELPANVEPEIILSESFI